MKINKYSKSGTSNPALTGGGSGGSSTSTEYVGSSLNRTIWGQEDTGDDVNGSMTVNGDIHIKVIEDLPDVGDDDEDDDGSGEYEEYETGGGSLFVDLTVRAKDVEAIEDLSVGRHLFINYPKHPEHDEANKKCIGEILFGIETDVSANKSEISSLKSRVTTAESEITSLKSRVTTNETNISTNTDEIEKLKKKTTDNATAIQDLMPLGSIIMFSGTLAEIPTHWAVCDGTNGTPNLIDRFIKASTTAGTTGGSNSITLNSDNLPYHTHSATALSTYTNSNIPADYNDKVIPALNELFENSYDLGGGDHYVFETGYHNKSDKGLVEIKVGDLKAGTVNTTVTVNGTGSSEAIDVQPAFYSLIFIMKVA